MDSLLGITIAVFFFAILLFAAIRDYQIREVPNRVWIVGLCGIPLTIFRIGATGLLLQYGIQALVVFIFVLITFQLGILGGADGKAILLISLLYPWVILNPLWLVVAPFLVLIGGFLIVGVYSIWLLIRNKNTSRKQKSVEIALEPTRKMFWLTRRLTVESLQKIEWEPVEVPLVLYFLVSYTALLILTGLLL